MLIASVTMGADKCSSNGAPDYQWNPEIYATDSKSQVIVRKDEVIRTSDPRFDKFIAIRATEIGKAKQAYYDVINQCDRWKKTKSKEQINELLEEDQEFFFGAEEKH